MSAILVKARALCVCNQIYSSDAVVDEVEITNDKYGVVLDTVREVHLLKVAKAVLEHSRNHERVAMMLTLNMEEAPKDFPYEALAKRAG